MSGHTRIAGRMEAQLTCDLARGLDQAARRSFSVRAFINISGQLEFNVDDRRTVTKTIQQMVLRRTKAAANIKPGLTWEAAGRGAAVEEAGVGHIYQVSQVCETVSRQVFTNMQDFVHVTGRLSFNVDNRRLVNMDLSHMVLSKPESPVSPVDIDTDCGEFSPLPSPLAAEVNTKEEPGDEDIQHIGPMKSSPDSRKDQTEGPRPKMTLFSPTRPQEVLTSVNRGPRMLSFACMEPIQLPATGSQQCLSTSPIPQISSPIARTSPLTRASPVNITLPVTMTLPMVMSPPKTVTSPMSSTSPRVGTSPMAMTSPRIRTASMAMNLPVMTNKSPATQSVDWEAGSAVYDSGISEPSHSVCDLFSSPQRAQRSFPGRLSQRSRDQGYSPMNLTMQSPPPPAPEPVVSPQEDLFSLTLDEGRLKWEMLSDHCPPPDMLWPSLGEEEDRPQSAKSSATNPPVATPALDGFLESDEDEDTTLRTVSPPRRLSSKRRKTPRVTMPASPSRKRRGRLPDTTRSKNTEPACAESSQNIPPKTKRVSKTDTADGMSSGSLCRDSEINYEITDNSFHAESHGTEGLDNCSTFESMAGDFCQDFPSDYEQLLDAESVVGHDFDDKVKEICKRNSQDRESLDDNSPYEAKRKKKRKYQKGKSIKRNGKEPESESEKGDLSVRKTHKDYSQRKKRIKSYDNQHAYSPEENVNLPNTDSETGKDNGTSENYYDDITAGSDDNRKASSKLSLQSENDMNDSDNEKKRNQGDCREQNVAMQLDSESHDRQKPKRRSKRKIKELKKRNVEDQEESSDYDQMVKNMQKAYTSAKRQIESSQVDGSIGNTADGKDNTLRDKEQYTVNEFGESNTEIESRGKDCDSPRSPEELNRKECNDDCANEDEMSFPRTHIHSSVSESNVGEEAGAAEVERDLTATIGELCYMETGDDDTQFAKIYDSGEAVNPGWDENEIQCQECSFTTTSPGLFQFHKLKEHSVWKDQFNPKSDIKHSNNLEESDINEQNETESQNSEDHYTSSVSQTGKRTVAADTRSPLTRAQLAKHLQISQTSADSNGSDSSLDWGGLLKTCTVRLRRLEDMGYSYTQFVGRATSKSSCNVSEGAQDTSSEETSSRKSKKRVKRKTRYKPDGQRNMQQSDNQISISRLGLKGTSNRKRYDSTEEDEDMTRVSLTERTKKPTRSSNAQIKRNKQSNRNSPSSSANDQPLEVESRGNIDENTNLKCDPCKPDEPTRDLANIQRSVNDLQSTKSNKDTNTKTVDTKEAVTAGEPSEFEPMPDLTISQNLNSVSPTADMQSFQTDGEMAEESDTEQESLTLSTEEKYGENIKDGLSAQTDTPQSPSLYQNSSSETEAFEFENSDRNFTSNDDISEHEDNNGPSRNSVEQKDHIENDQNIDKDLNDFDKDTNSAEPVLDNIADLNVEEGDEMAEGNVNVDDMEDGLNERIRKQSQLITNDTDSIARDENSQMQTPNETITMTEGDKHGLSSEDDSQSQNGISLKPNAKASNQQRRFQAGNIVFNFPFRDKKESKDQSQSMIQKETVESNKTKQDIKDLQSSPTANKNDYSDKEQNPSVQKSCTTIQYPILTSCIEDTPKNMESFKQKYAAQYDAQTSVNMGLHDKHSQGLTHHSMIKADTNELLVDQSRKSTNIKPRSFEEERDSLGRFCCLNCPFKSMHVKIYINHVQKNHVYAVKYQCNVCGQVYRKSNQFTAHLYKHMHEKQEESKRKKLNPEDHPLDRVEEAKCKLDTKLQKLWSKGSIKTASVDMHRQNLHSSLVNKKGTNASTCPKQIRLHLYVKSQNSAGTEGSRCDNPSTLSDSGNRLSTSSMEHAHNSEESTGEAEVQDSSSNNFMTCPFCFQGGFRNLPALMRHKRVCNKGIKKGRSPKKPRCPLCQKKIGLKQNVQQHVSVAHPHTCLSCRNVYQDLGSLDSHKCEVKKKVTMCPDCGKLYRSEKSLSNHMQLIHKHLQHREKTLYKPKFMGTGSKLKGTSMKGEDLVGESEHLTHKEVPHDKPTVKDERIKACCYVCLTNLYTTKTLESHLYKHNITFKNYMCNRCGRQFSHKARLDHHISLKHSEELYKCSICKRVYSTFQALLLHKKTHSEIRTCRYCDKVLHSVWHRQRHERWHERHNLLRCDSCQISFDDLSGLLQHKISKHPKSNAKNEYVCPICRYKYKEIRELYKHIAVVHKGHSEATAWFENYKKKQCDDHKSMGKSTIHKHKPLSSDNLVDSNSAKSELDDLLSVLPGEDLQVDPFNSSGVSEMLQDLGTSSMTLFEGQNSNKDVPTAAVGSPHDSIVECGEDMVVSPTQMYYLKMNSGTTLKPDIRKNNTI